MDIKVGYHKTHDLRESFPISRLYAFRKTMAWFAVGFALLLLTAFASKSHYFAGLSRTAILRAELIIIAVLMVKCIYAELYRRTFYYGLEGFRIMISRGVLIREKASLPLLPATEIYVHRNIVDMILGLCNVDIYTPVGATRQFARIEALSVVDAERLQKIIGETLSTQVFLAPEAEGRDVIEMDIRSAPRAHVPAMMPESRIAFEKMSLPVANRAKEQFRMQ